MSEQDCDDIELISAIEGLIDNELSDEQFVKLQSRMMNESSVRADSSSAVDDARAVDDPLCGAEE